MRGNTKETTKRIIIPISFCSVDSFPKWLGLVHNPVIPDIPGHVNNYHCKNPVWLITNLDQSITNQPNYLKNSSFNNEPCQAPREPRHRHKWTWHSEAWGWAEKSPHVTWCQQGHLVLLPTSWKNMWLVSLKMGVQTLQKLFKYMRMMRIPATLKQVLVGISVILWKIDGCSLKFQKHHHQ